ncbi:MAG: hypothetical protein M1834_004254 [Cirrosporium novae-zelandiae]|nr:MAG: hypothetical protein M1834_004254 [Cirrosporium novae-zelandiae]
MSQSEQQFWDSFFQEPASPHLHASEDFSCFDFSKLPALELDSDFWLPEPLVGPENTSSHTSTLAEQTAPHVCIKNETQISITEMEELHLRVEQLQQELEAQAKKLEALRIYVGETLRTWILDLISALEEPRSAALQVSGQRKVEETDDS